MPGAQPSSLGTRAFGGAWPAAARPAAPVFALQKRWPAAAFLDEADVTDRVLGCLKNFQKADPPKVTAKSHFMNDLGLDSLDTVEVVMAFEDEFALIPDADAEKIASADEAIVYSEPPARPVSHGSGERCASRVRGTSSGRVGGARDGMRTMRCSAHCCGERSLALARWARGAPPRVRLSPLVAFRARRRHRREAGEAARLVRRPLGCFPSIDSSCFFPVLRRDCAHSSGGALQSVLRQSRPAGTHLLLF